MKKRNSANDYLERILLLQKKKGFARSVDLARELGVTKPTVCNAVKRLRERDLIDIDEKGYIIFTDSGRSMAEKSYRKHKLIAKTLIGIGVGEETADRDACLIERVISDETYRCFKTFYKSHLQVSNN